MREYKIKQLSYFIPSPSPLPQGTLSRLTAIHLVPVGEGVNGTAMKGHKGYED
jgi:hypothetical protein